MRNCKMLPATIMKEQIIQIKCDVCGKTIKPGQSFWDLSTSHSDWGNDSIDSHREFDLCSEECVRTKLKDYFRNSEHSSTQSFWLDQAVEYYNLDGGKENGEN